MNEGKLGRIHTFAAHSSNVLLFLTVYMTDDYVDVLNQAWTILD